MKKKTQKYRALVEIEIILPIGVDPGLECSAILKQDLREYNWSLEDVVPVNKSWFTIKSTK